MNRNEPEIGTEGWEMPGCRLKLANFVILVLLAALWAGCKQNDAQPLNPADTNMTATAEPSLPAGPQPKLQTMKIFLGAETMDAELALTPSEEETGLMYRTNITDETSMLFVLPYPMRASFWMTNCPMSLSCAYISPDGIIEEIHHLEKDDNVPVEATNENILYVLEVNDGWFARHNINTGTVIRTERGALADTFSRK
jgi:uncharacterized protein